MLSLSGLSNTHKRFLWALMIGVFIVSSVIVLMYNDYFLLGDLQKKNNDDVKYIHSAQVLLNHGTLAYNSGEKPSAFIMPGVPLLLGGAMSLFGQGEGGIAAFRLFQCLQQAFCIYLIFVLAKYLFNTRVAFVASIISALYLPDYFSSGVILSETTFRTIMLVLVCATIMAIESKKVFWYAAVGVLVAAAAYFKPHASLYPALFLLLWWRRNYSWRERLRFLLIIAGVYIVLLLPWWIRNYVTFDRFILFTDSAGSPFLLGTRVSWQLPPAGFFEAYPQYDPQTVFNGADSSAIAKGLDILKYGFTHNTFTYTYWYTIGKMLELYMNPFYWRPIWPLSREAMKIVQIALMIFSLLGLGWALFTNSVKRQLPVLLTLVYFTAIYLPFVAFSRYGYPNVVFLIPYAAYLITVLYEKVGTGYHTRNKEITLLRKREAVHEQMD